MKTLFVEKTGATQRVYNSILVNPKNFGIFNTDLSVNIISEIARQPQCAMDVAKKLKIHEQKVYYYLRKFKKAGIVRMTREEPRYGMTAKIFSVVSPVIATKLYGDGYSLTEDVNVKNPIIQDALKPFIIDGKLNAKIIIGDPYPHGQYDRGSLDGCYISDLTLLLGYFLKEVSFPCYRLDISINENDLKGNNLITIGNPKGNLITDKLNNFLPIYFDRDDDWTITSKISGKNYRDDLAGIIVKDTNPFNKKKWVLVLAGMRTRGTLASVIAFTKHIDDIVNDMSDDGKIAKIIHGLDKDGDGIIDSIKVVE